MKQTRNAGWIARATLACLVIAAGCAKPQQLKPTSPVTAAAKAARNREQRYLVRRGDSLWKIASRPQVLGDPFQWPLLYRQNRDQIQDPDLIEPNQDLDYQWSYGHAEAAAAVKLARETPPYVPHAKPRKSLPINY